MTQTQERDLPEIIRILAEWECENGTLAAVLPEEWEELRLQIADAAVKQSPRMIREAWQSAVLSRTTTDDEWMEEAEHLAGTLAGKSFQHGYACRSREDDSYNEAMDAEVDAKDRARNDARAALLAHLSRRPAGAAEGSIREALDHAATSLETISTLAGRKTYGNPPIETYMDSFMDVRLYAAARAKVAREALAAGSAQTAAPAPAVPDLHPRTADLVDRFALALKEKLAAAEKKYGYSDGWADPGWMDECRSKLIEHVHKGDPRDVAAYCAFLWHHGERCELEDQFIYDATGKWPTKPAALSPSPSGAAVPPDLLAIFTEWARQVSERADVPQGIRYAAAQLHKQGMLAASPTAPAAVSVQPSDGSSD